MSDTLRRVREVIARDLFRFSDHAYEELTADGILPSEVLAGIHSATIVEDYPDYPKGPCVLVLQKDSDGAALHVLWGIPKNQTEPAVLVTVYRPDPARWSADFTKRKR